MATETVESALQSLDASIDSLASSGDFEALAALLADDFVYSHSTGAIQDKGEWLAGLKPLVGRRQRVVSGVRAEIHGDVAVVTGDVDIVWKDAPTKYNRYVRVFRFESGTWRAISQRTVPGYDRDPGAAH